MGHIESLLERVGPLLKPYAGTCGIVAVSGGADSVALAHLLTTDQARGQLSKIILAHLNHQLRGADSDADEAFVLALAKQLGLTARSHQINVLAASQAEGGNLESVARRLRYRWLTQLAQDEGAAWVATGHSADDQAETVLHRLLRGTGLHGLGGIPCQRELASGVMLLRPLLKITRAEIIAYLQAANQLFREDASNTDLRFTRNRLRHELLPFLAQHFNPAITAVLGQLAEQAQAAQEIIAAEAFKLCQQAELPRAGKWLIFDPAPLAQAPRHLLREMFRLVWQREGWPQSAMDFAGWDRLAAAVTAEPTAHDFPDAVKVRRTERVLQLGRG